MKKIIFLLVALSLTSSVFASDFTFTLDNIEPAPAPPRPAPSTPSSSSSGSSSSSSSGSSNYNDYNTSSPTKEIKNIQYVLDNTEKYPNFVDTGIQYTNNLPYDTVFELVNQIAVKKRGDLIESEKQLLICIDGRVIVFDKNKPLSFNTFVSKFDKTKVSIKAQESRKEGRFALADYLEMNKNARLIVNNQEVELFNEPVIDNDLVLFPMREIVTGLGAEIEWDDSKEMATITKGNLTIVLKMDSNIITVNGNNVELGAKFIVVKGKDGNRIFGHMDYIVEKLGGEVYWDAKQMAIVIEPK